MADAALPAARRVLGLTALETPITAQPLQPLAIPEDSANRR
jgi:hypothetical protein